MVIMRTCKNVMTSADRRLWSDQQLLAPNNSLEHSPKIYHLLLATAS